MGGSASGKGGSAFCCNGVFRRHGGRSTVKYPGKAVLYDMVGFEHGGPSAGGDFAYTFLLATGRAGWCI